MPRILWEQTHDSTCYGSWRNDRLTRLRQIVAEEVTRYDPSFRIDWEKHTITDIVVRDIDAEGGTEVMITVRGSNKPSRIGSSKKIGDAIYAKADHLFSDDNVKWSLTLCWDEHYYNDGEG